MDIYQLKYFVTAASRCNFSKAAEELNITRQALSKAMKKLEDQCGSPLFWMNGSVLELTDIGHILLDEAAAVVDCYDQFCINFEKKKNQTRHSLTLAIAQGVSLTLPNSFLSQFRQQEKQITLSVEETYTDAVVDLVEQGEFDIGLVGSAPTYLENLDYHLLVPTGIHLYVPLQHKLANKTSLTLEDLDGQHFVTAGKRNHLHRFFMDRCKKAGVHPEVVVSTTDLAMMQRLIPEDNLLCFGFPENISPVPKNEKVLPLILEEDTLFGTYAIKRKGQVLSAPAQKMWQYLTNTEI